MQIRSIPWDKRSILSVLLEELLLYMALHSPALVEAILGPRQVLVGWEQRVYTPKNTPTMPSLSKDCKEPSLDDILEDKGMMSGRRVRSRLPY